MEPSARSVPAPALWPEESPVATDKDVEGQPSQVFYVLATPAEPPAEGTLAAWSGRTEVWTGAEGSSTASPAGCGKASSCSWCSHGPAEKITAQMEKSGKHFPYVVTLVLPQARGARSVTRLFSR